ncbi:hypothetical protein [Streptomyces atratus]|uniref:Uncharacterized protein n=1 Tax=Streptomyces atratus TaxID=1893 RepID=A0A2Z5J833_STRAR|nr:hypothetical protein [Streptomyces atratus]AXE76373.1 hypothetical protein C5746_04780 [Streptomyces atratus]
MKKTLAWAVTLVTAATCALGTALPAAAADDVTASASIASSGSPLDTSRLPPEAKALVDQALADLPADWQERRDAAAAKYGIHDTQWAGILNSAIKPGDYQCQNTEFRDYSTSLLAGVDDPELLDWLYVFSAFDLPTYEALFFGSESKSNTFGYNGEYTNQLTSEGKNLKRFWDIHSDDIQIVPMHGGEFYSSPERVARTLAVLYGIKNDAVVLRLAKVITGLVNDFPSLKGGDNPIFTFNAFAYSEEGNPNPSGISDRIVVGDGILEAMNAIGLGDTAPRAVLAHEFGHHVQYEDKLIDKTTLTGPEATRRTELMADAFGTYFLTHSRGEALNTKRVLDSAKSFYQVGDCSFSSVGHHGTPNQRLASSAWGASVVNDAADQGHILPSLKLDELFEAKLPDIVKPDATN